MGPLKLSPASGLTFQPAVFYWAYLQRGLAGSWESLGSPAQPLTHSAAPTIQLGLNYSHLCCVPGRFAPESRCHMNRSESGRHKHVTCSLLFYIWQLKTPFRSWSISGASLWRECFQVCKVFPLTKLLSIWWVCVELYIGTDIWANFKESLALIQSRSSHFLPLPRPCPPSSSFLFYLHLSHVPSIPLSSPSSSAAPFSQNYARVLLSLLLQISRIFFLYLCQRVLIPSSLQKPDGTHTRRHTHACAFN